MNASFKVNQNLRRILIGLLLIGAILSMWTATARDDCGFCTANLPAAAMGNIAGAGALALGIGFVAIGMVAGSVDPKRPRNVLVILIIGAIAAIIALFALKDRPYVEEGGISGTVAATSVAIMFLYLAFIVMLMARTQEAAGKAATPATEPIPAHEEEHHILIIEGIGTKYASRLNHNGIITQPQLVRADARAIAKHAGCTTELAEEWQGSARLMGVKGIGPQFAEILAMAGLRTVEQLASSDPEALLAKVDAIEERRKVRVLKTDVKLHHIEKFIQAAQAHS